jgi:hypothetical protein
MYDLARTPEQLTAMLGWQSVQPGWKQVIRIAFDKHPEHHRIYWANRATAIDAQRGGYKSLNVRDRQIDPHLYHYKTDEAA